MSSSMLLHVAPLGFRGFNNPLLTCLYPSMEPWSFPVFSVVRGVAEK